MSYFEPYIDSSGFHMPTYVDIRDDLINQMKSIFGNDIYIDEDGGIYYCVEEAPLNDNKI